MLPSSDCSSERPQGSLERETVNEFKREGQEREAGRRKVWM